MTNNYDFEIDLSEVLGGNVLVEEILHMNDLKARKLFLNEEINMATIEPVCKHILRYNADDKGKPVEERQPIILYLSSNGGEIYSGYQLIDVIMASKTPVYTVNLGFQLSMGFMIGLAGHKRFATPNAKYLIHDGSSVCWNSTSKVRDEMEFHNKNEERMRQFVLDRTKITPDMYDSKLRVEWYMFADEAKEVGVTDCIIGVDCDMDEVI